MEEYMLSRLSKKFFKYNILFQKAEGDRWRRAAILYLILISREELVENLKVNG